MILATFSTRSGMVRSFVEMALVRVGRDNMQSRVLAPSRRSTMNSHCKSVQAANHAGGCPLQTTLEEVKIKIWAVNQLLTVPTAQILAKFLHKNVRAAAYWQSWHVKPKSINEPTQRRKFKMGFVATAVQWCHTHSVQDVFLPCWQELPHFFTLFIEFFAAAPMGFRSVDATIPYPKVHLIENDGINTQQNKFTHDNTWTIRNKWKH